MGQKCVRAGAAASLDEAVLGEGWKKGVKASQHHSPSDTESLQPHTQPPFGGDTLWVSCSRGGCLILALDPRVLVFSTSP